MKVLHVDTGREMRGGQRQALLLLEGLREQGEVECALLARGGAPLYDAAQRAGMRVFAAGWRAVQRHSEWADLVHAHDGKAHTLCALAARAPFVVSRRVAFPVQRSWLSQWKYRQAKRYLAVSRFVAGELAKAEVAERKIDIVYDAAPGDVRVAVWDRDAPAVALASHDAAKGRDLAAAAAEIAKIRITYSEDLPRDLARASMFLYLTRSEGLGSAALLAMAMGIPVIASAVGGLPEALGEGEAGLLTANEPTEIAAAMQRLRENSELGRTMIQRAKMRIAGHFTKERMLEATLQSYRRALAG